MVRINDFLYSDAPEPHKARTKAILRAHPEIRNLMGRFPASFLLIVFVVGIQITIAILLRESPWWLSLILGFCFGAFASHALYVLIHDSAHNLIFKNRSLNYVSGILADLPNVLPSAISFRAYHHKHHSYQGNYYLDADLASRWEARLIGNTFIGKSFWELMFPFFQAIRTPRMKDIPFMNFWTVLNMVVVFAFDVAMVYFFGWSSFLYLIFSFFFSIGFHPLGARWIQEHFIVLAPQETYSYYGPLNILALNVGYHNEHHDFPSVPWVNLPKVKAAAPEFYESLYYHKSWVRLWLRFIFDPKLSLFSRMVRTNRDDVPIVNE